MSLADLRDLGALWFDNLPRYRRPVISERERNNINDKAFKVAPKLELTSEQYRLRESGRCGRMRR